MRRRRSLGGGFSPRKLFADGTVGAWYDPSDYSTLFQDSAGTNPVTAVEQSVGLIKDKSGNNNHASQVVTSSCPVLRARYNILLGTETLATQSVTTVSASYKLSFTGTGSITLSGTATGTYSIGTNTITCTAGTLILTVTGVVTQADLRLASTSASMPAYQRVTTATDYTTAGFLPYLAFNTDDSFNTGNINFTGTNKLAVVAGITKLNTTAAFNCLLESGATGANGIAIFAPDASNNNYSFWLKGLSRPTSTSVYTAPITNVISVQNDCSLATAALQTKPRINGSSVSITGTNIASSANFANEPLFIGRRNNATLPFNGRIYGLIVAGKTLSASELSATEAWMNIKTGAY